MEMADGDRLTPEQAEALSALRDGRNVFLSGNAGTGKSYVLNAFISDLKARNVDFLALAPTGTLRRLPCTRRATGPSTRARLTLRCS